MPAVLTADIVPVVLLVGDAEPVTAAQLVALLVDVYCRLSACAASGEKKGKRNACVTKACPSEFDVLFF